jgi:hypothetical protein
MRGQAEILNLQSQGHEPDAIFVIEDKAVLNQFQIKNTWFPEVIVKKTDPVASMDFSFVEGIKVHAVLGDNYSRSFRICQAIAEAKPLYLIANIAGGHPLLEWSAWNGFHENE